MRWPNAQAARRCRRARTARSHADEKARGEQRRRGRRDHEEDADDGDGEPPCSARIGPSLAIKGLPAARNSMEPAVPDAARKPITSMGEADAS